MSARRAPWFGRLARLLIREILSHAAIATLVGVGMFVIVDFVEVSNMAIERVHTADLLGLSWYGIPNMLRRVLMVTAPIGAITAIGSMVRRSELVAAFSTGASPLLILKPVLAVGSLLAVLLALNAELLVPPSYPRVTAIRRQLELSDSPLDDPGRQSWFKGSRHLYRVESMLAQGGAVLGGVMMLRIAGGRLIERWDVERLVFAGGVWTGQAVLHRAPMVEAGESGEDGNERLLTERFEQHAIPMEELPDDFVNGIASPASLPFSALHKVTLARERLGSPALAHRMELYQRFSGPLVLLLGMVLASALAVRLGRRHSMAGALGIGALVGFSIWYLREFERLFAAAGNLAPELVSVIVPLILLSAAVSAWVRVERLGVLENA